MEQPQRPFTPYNAPVKDAKLLPAQAPAQVYGRNHELGSGHAALKAGRAVLLHGPAGIGKTAVAAVLATAYTVQNLGGVLWFNMTEDDADLLLARVGRAYGVNALTTNQEDPMERISVVRALLERNRPLIVLDGLTDVAAVRSFARDVAIGIPMIITDETETAGSWLPIALGPLSLTDSVQMLRALSGLKDTAYTADLEGLCRVLDGDPLALSLAGRHMAADDVTPAELLTNFLAAVPAGTSKADPQQTIITVIYKRLIPAVQGIFLMLGATFAGGASAELVSDLSNLPAQSVAPVMRQLVVHGLAHESVVYNQLRFTLHESVQAFARRLLQTGNRLQAVENRALQAVIAYTLRHARSDAANHDRLAAETDNIMGAAAYATSTNQEQAIRQLMQAISQQAGDFVTLRGFQPELAQLRKLLLLLVRTDQPSSGSMKSLTPTPTPTGRSTQTMRPVQPPVSLPEPTPAPTSDLPETQAVLPVDIADEPVPIVSEPTPEPPPEVIPAASSVIEAEPVTESKPQPSLFTGLWSAPTPAASPTTQSEPKPDTIPADEPVAEQPPIPEPAIPLDLDVTPPPNSTKPMPAPVLEPVGEPINETLHEPASELHSEITELDLLDNPQFAEPPVPSNATQPVAAPSAPPPPTTTAEATQTPTVLSIGTLQTRISEAQANNDKRAQARYLEMLGDAYTDEGDDPRAIEAYQRAVEASRGDENWQSIGLLMGKLGNAYLNAGRTQEAIMMLEQALTIFRRERRTDYESRILGTLGSAYGEARNWPKAQEYHEQALYLARERGDRLDEATQLGNLAYIRELQDQREGSVTYYRQALHLAYLIGHDEMRGDYSFQLGRLLMDDGRTLSQAERLLTDADQLIPQDAEIERLLKRARKRLEHFKAGGMTISEALSNEQYAAESYPAPAG